jgi:tetratricopeptide (TPR) repeat protein
MNKDDEYQYVLAFSEGRYEDAKKSLYKAILCEAKNKDAPPWLAGFVQRLGTITFRQGDEAGALAMYEISELIDVGSLLVKLDYAKFLLKEMGNKTAAISKSQEIIDSATSFSFPESSGDFSSDQYIEAAKRVIDEAENKE